MYHYKGLTCTCTCTCTCTWAATSKEQKNFLLSIVIVYDFVRRHSQALCTPHIRTCVYAIIDDVRKFLMSTIIFACMEGFLELVGVSHSSQGRVYLQGIGVLGGVDGRVGIVCLAALTGGWPSH